MITVTLEAFFRTGMLGPVHLGMSRDQIQKAFGVPDDVGLVSRKYRRPSLWKYGDLELIFVQGGDELTLIHLDGFQIPQAGGELQLDPWIIRGGMTRGLVEHHLTACSLPFQPIQSPEGYCTWLQVGAGVVLVFIDEERLFSPPTGLYSISLSSRRG